MRKTVLWIFGLALLARGIIAFIQMMYGISIAINFDGYLYGSFNPGLEIYTDFYGYYVVQLADLAKGLVPYTQIIYTYPPLFLYSLYPFYLLGGSHAASIPIWLSDAATAPLVYLVARHFTSPRLSVIAGVSYALSPFFLLYEGYLWFSSQPMTFFMVLSFYLLLTKRPLWSALVFAIAVLFRQELIFIFPIYLIWYCKHYPKSISLKAVAVAGSVIFLVSLPFLLISPGVYIFQVSYGILNPAGIGASHSSNLLGQLTNSVTSSLNCNTISDTWRSLVCNYGNFTYTDAKLVPSWTTIFSAGFINYISIWIFFPLLAAVLYNLIRLRRDTGAWILSGCLIMTTVLALFSFVIHPIYRYYLIPVYIMPLVTSRTRLSISIAIAIPLVSLIFPSGFVQLLFPLLDCFTILLLNQKASLTVLEDRTSIVNPTLP